MSFFTDTPTTEIYTLSLHDALPIFVADALAMAVHHRRPRRGLVHHSDKGSQYTSLVFGHQLRESGLVASTGSVGDALDNRSEEHTSELQSRLHLVCRLLLEKKKKDA